MVQLLRPCVLLDVAGEIMQKAAQARIGRGECGRGQKRASSWSTNFGRQFTTHIQAPNNVGALLLTSTFKQLFGNP